MLSFMELVRRLSCWSTEFSSQCQATCVSTCSGERKNAPIITVKNASAVLEPIRLSRRNSRRPLYFTVDLGTPPTRVGVRPVSYSPDTWILSESASYCQTEVCNHGIFGEQQSSTYTEAAPPQANASIPALGLKYGGHGFRDTIKLAGVTAVNMSMKLALESSGGLSLLGLDQRASTSETQEEGSFLEELADKGFISTPAYSVWLGGPDDDNCGSILFGAVDHSKYDGTLWVLRTHRVVASAWGGRYVALSGLNASSPTGTDALVPDDTAVPVQVVFGKWTNVLPAPLAAQMWRAAGAHYSADAGAALLPCAKRASAGWFDVQLGGARGPVLRVGMRQLVVPKGEYGEGATAAASASSGGAVVADDDGDGREGLCEFNLANSTDPADWRLGDGFLRAAYVLFDPRRRRLAVAPLAGGGDDGAPAEDVERLADPPARHDHDTHDDDDDDDDDDDNPHDGDGIPRAALVPNQPTDLDVPSLPAPPDATSLASADGFASSLEVVADPGDADGGGGDGGGGKLTTAARVAIGVGVTLGALLALALLLWLRARRRLQRARVIIRGLRASSSSSAMRRALPAALELPTGLHGPGPTYELGETKARARRELPSS